MLKNAPLITLLLCCIGLVVVQAQCGAISGVSCEGSNCCSAAGFCGEGPLYCGVGCQVGFGSCDVSGGTTTASAPGTPAPSATFTDPITSVPAITTTTTTTTTTESSSTSTSARGTYQLQPTGKPSAAALSQEKDMSKLALVIVLLAGLIMV